MVLTAIEAVLREMGAVRSFIHPWYFPTIGEYTPLLERHGLLVTEAILFDRPTRLEEGEKGLSNWIEMFAKDLFAPIPPDRRPIALRQVEDRLRPILFREGAWYVDYKKIRVIAVKEPSRSS